MKIGFRIKLNTTRNGIRIFINGLKTKYYASGGGYDKVGDVFNQFINDNFIDSNLFNESKWGISSCKAFISLIGGSFETIVSKKDLYYITFDSSKLTKYAYKITKNSKGQSFVWANDRVESIFYNEDDAIKHLEDLQNK